MKNWLLIIPLILLSVMSCKDNSDPMSKPEVRAFRSDSIAKAVVMERIYYPDTYDPIKTQIIDSLKLSIYLHPKAIEAANKIIDDSSAIRSSQSVIDANNERIRELRADGFGIFHYRHNLNENEREQAKINQCKENIRLNSNIIIDANADDFDRDRFVGYAIYHKFRCGDNSGRNYIKDWYIVTDTLMRECYYVFDLDEDDSHNYNNIKKTIDSVLSTNN